MAPIANDNVITRTYNRFRCVSEGNRRVIYRLSAETEAEGGRADGEEQ